MAKICIPSRERQENNVIAWLLSYVNNNRGPQTDLCCSTIINALFPITGGAWHQMLQEQKAKHLWSFGHREAVLKKTTTTTTKTKHSKKVINMIKPVVAMAALERRRDARVPALECSLLMQLCLETAGKKQRRRRPLVATARHYSWRSSWRAAAAPSANFSSLERAIQNLWAQTPRVRDLHPQRLLEPLRLKQHQVTRTEGIIKHFLQRLQPRSP